MDTGSRESIISKSNLCKFYPSYILHPSSVTVRGITGHSLSVLGQCTIPLFNDKHELLPCVFIVVESGPSILGLKSMESLHISLSFVTTHSVDEEIESLILKCFQATGGMKIPPVKLEISGDPIFLKRRIIPYGLIEPVKKVLDTLVSSGTITPVDSSAWATPIVTPLKSDGKTPRVCGDYRLTLNPHLLQHTCTTAEPEDVLNKLFGSQMFSKIDLKNAYLQIPLDEESKFLTTINTPFGLYQYNFLPFGLNVSPAIFQQIMNNIVKNLDGVEVYQDDVIVHAPSKSMHDECLLQLFRRLSDANILVNPDKCCFSVHHFKCLGYVVDASGFRPDPDRLSPLINTNSPTSMTELRSLIGALQYYSRFIPNFSHTANCLFQILSEKSFRWGSQKEKCLRSLLKVIQSEADPTSILAKSTYISYY